RWLSRFHSDERQVGCYRTGRVFLAGDAAHVHSPAGGQGMNAGLQDAANLGWKLAAAVQGWAPPDLLDTYHSERHPVGAAVLRGSGALLRMAMLRPWPLRTARRHLGGVLSRIGPVRRRVAGTASGIDIAYPAPRGAHRLVGARAPDTSLVGIGRLYEALRGGRFVLLSRRPLDLSGWSDRVVQATSADAAGAVTLVRPDGYIAWASDQTDPAALRTALTRWCGAPADRTTPP
nr:FAD-dependent monooxygenase [Geodermatophilaceae bacterium]